jgi:hypothetical protein
MLKENKVSTNGKNINHDSACQISATYEVEIIIEAVRLVSIAINMRIETTLYLCSLLKNFGNRAIINRAIDNSRSLREPAASTSSASCNKVNAKT